MGWKWLGIGLAGKVSGAAGVCVCACVCSICLLVCVKCQSQSFMIINIFTFHWVKFLLVSEKSTYSFLISSDSFIQALWTNVLDSAFNKFSFSIALTNESINANSTQTHCCVFKILLITGRRLLCFYWIVSGNRPFCTLLHQESVLLRQREEGVSGMGWRDGGRSEDVFLGPTSGCSVPLQPLWLRDKADDSHEEKRKD